MSVAPSFKLSNKIKYDEAEPYYREALEGFRRVLSDDHPNILTVEISLAELLETQDKPE